jgi:DNA-binding MarR family transcriptional regulator
MEESLVRLLGRTCRLHRGVMHAVWDELGLYRGQPFMLAVLWEQEGVTHSELARRMHVSPATVSNMIKRLEKSGFVERRPDAQDQRVSHVYLTDAGRAIRERVDGQWQEIEERVFGSFSQEEQALLRALLERVREALTQLYDGPEEGPLRAGRRGPHSHRPHHGGRGTEERSKA